MPRISKFVAITATIILSAIWCHSQQASKPLSFSSEDDKVASFVELPKSVLVLLVQDREDFPDGPPPNVHCQDHETVGDGDEPQPQILCRKVILSSRAGNDYLVIGVGGLRGAHIVPFWLFHSDKNGASLLFKTRSDEIEITSARFNGYAEIRSTSIQGAGALIVTDSFRFNGKHYVMYRSEKERQ